MKPIEVLLLSQSDLRSLALSHEDVMGAIELALVEHSNATYEMHPKIGVHPTGTDPGNFIHAMPAYLKQLGVCGLKWVGGFARNGERGFPNVTGIQVCNDIETGVPLAIMDCAYLTGLRTAAVSASIARCCARKDASVLALCGCGFEGGLHLEFLVRTLPNIRQVRCYDVRIEAATALAESARAAGYLRGEIEVCDSAEACIRDADVISTCTNGAEQIIRKEWFKAGAFGVGIEGGCAYQAEALHQADKFIVDDIPLVEYFQKISIEHQTDPGDDNLEFPGGLPPIYSTIGDVVAGKKTARESAEERIIAIPIGMAICDIALGHLVYQRARAKQAGQIFRLA